jgi:hypothetical protein
MLPNGLYAVEMKTLDGVNAVATGVAVARDGVVMGGDPYFYYTGTYSCKDGRIKGELVNKQHTPYRGMWPLPAWLHPTRHRAQPRAWGQAPHQAHLLLRA